MKAVGWIIGAIFLAGVAVAACVAVINDEDSMPVVQLVSHEYDDGGYYDDRGDQNYEDQWSNEDRNRNRGRNRGAFSPGPFDDSPVDAFNNACLPGATCYYDGRRGDEPPPEQAPA